MTLLHSFLHSLPPPCLLSLRWLVGGGLLYLLPRAFAYSVGPEQHHLRWGRRLLWFALGLGLVEVTLLL